MEIFFVQRIVTWRNFNKRVCSYHSSVFHGIGFRKPISHTVLPKTPWLTNDNGSRLVIRRSGRYTPEVFSPEFPSLVVSKVVRAKLSALTNVEFREVECARLVDVPMPALGDFSWYDRITDPPGPEPDYEFSTLPDKPEFHNHVGAFYELLVANLYDLRKGLGDIRKIRVHYGTFSGCAPEVVLFSPSLLRKYPIVWTGPYIFREDAFELIAPHLDLDYYAIARRSFDEL